MLINVPFSQSPMSAPLAVVSCLALVFHLLCAFIEMSCCLKNNTYDYYLIL